MRPTDHLSMSCEADWLAATDHAFCRELAQGTLPIEKMKWYLAQDYQFIGSFVRLLATAVAHAPTLQDSIPAAQFLALITGPENTYFQRSFEALEMTSDEQSPEPAAETAAFIQLMDSARESGRYEQMLAVLVAAEWTYLTWAERCVDYPEDLPFWFAEWIDLHSGPGFAGVVEYLRSQFDKAWLTLTDEQQEAAQSSFVKAMALERAFFDAAYKA
ncbi:MAG: TenA family protein [Amphritea sp.]|nr:TenA family protein [Amphritea sp.]